VWWRFTTAGSPPVRKQSPVNGATGLSSAVMLRWESSLSDAGDGAGYFVCWYAIGDAARCDVPGNWTPTGRGIEKDLGYLTLPNGTYRWQVRGDAAGVSSFGDVGTWWSFTIGQGASAPGAFTGTAPAAGATVSGTAVALSWTASSGAASYEYCIDTTANGACDGSWQSAGTATGASVTGLTAGTTYSWQVRARNGAGTTDASGGWSSFTVAPAGPGCASVTVVAAPGVSNPSLVGVWQATGVTLSTGDAVTVTPSGTWTNGGVTTGGAGDPAQTLDGPNCPMAGQPSMELIGRIGATGVPLPVGTVASFTATSAGMLYLAPNDNWYTLWDNSGSLSVEVCLAAGNPAPVATSLTPATATAGGAAPTVTVTGSGFVTGSLVQWDGSARVTTFVSTTQLQVALQASDVAAAGVHTVTVVNASPGGGTSAGLTFTVAAGGQTCTTATVVAAPGGGNPTLATMWQSSGVTVHAGEVVTVTPTGTWTNAGVTTGGAGNAAVTLDGTNCPMAGQRSMAVIGRIGTSGASFLVGALGSFTATTTGVLYLAPNDNWYTLWDNSGSLAVSTCVSTDNPVPVATSLTPPTAAVGGPGLTLTVTGSGFVSSSVVQWNGSSRTTTYVSATQLAAAIPAGDVAAEGTATVTVVTPAPGGGTSAGLTFTVAPVSETCTTATVVAAPNVNSPSLVGMWQSMGVTVHAGDQVRVTPSGTWTNGGVTTGGAGDPAQTLDGTNCPMAGQRSMALIGRVGTDGASFVVGAEASFTATATGMLYLAPNDNWYTLWDNSGSLAVTICVSGTEPAPASEAAMGVSAGSAPHGSSASPVGEPARWVALVALAAVLAGRRRLTKRRWATGAARWATRRLAVAWPLWMGVGLALGLLLPTSVEAQSQPDPVEYYHLDAVGSVRAVTNSSGAVIRLHDFKPFGEEITTPSTADRKLFTGQERDYSTGLDYVGARYYRPDLGRFTTVDPEHVNGYIGDSQSWSPYASVRNNPLRYSDPSGTAYWINAAGGDLFSVDVESLDELRAYAFGDGFFVEGGIFSGIIKNRAGDQVATYTYFRSEKGTPSGHCDPFCQMVLEAGNRADAGLTAGSVFMLGTAVIGATGGLAAGIWGGGFSAVATPPYALWPSPLAGPTVINGIYYTVHALERMAPKGLGGRGVPVSVVENAIRFGTTQAGNVAGTVVHVFENVSVVTNLAGTRVITVIVTGR
jgi:RHS repeat-associated protein